jgi:hypothetical protein
MLTFL